MILNPLAQLFELQKSKREAKKIVGLTKSSFEKDLVCLLENDLQDLVQKTYYQWNRPFANSLQDNNFQFQGKKIPPKSQILAFALAFELCKRAGYELTDEQKEAVVLIKKGRFVGLNASQQPMHSTIMVCAAFVYMFLGGFVKVASLSEQESFNLHEHYQKIFPFGMAVSSLNSGGVGKHQLHQEKYAVMFAPFDALVIDYMVSAHAEDDENDFVANHPKWSDFLILDHSISLLLEQGSEWIEVEQYSDIQDSMTRFEFASLFEVVGGAATLNLTAYRKCLKRMYGLTFLGCKGVQQTLSKNAKQCYRDLLSVKKILKRQAIDRDTAYTMLRILRHTHETDETGFEHPLD